jgi:multimeric flavodoxin WrbA
MVRMKKTLDRFTGAFWEELGRWSARIVIAAVFVLASGLVALPS